MTDTEVTLALVAIMLVTSVVGGLAGFAFTSLAAVPTLHLLEPREAVPLITTASVAVQLVGLFGLRRHIQLGRCGPLMLGGLVGVPLGVMLLHHLDKATVAVIMGSFLLAYGAYGLLARPRVIRVAAEKAWDSLVGFAGGILGGILAVPGSLPIIWLSLKGAAKQEQRAVTQPYILAMQGLALAVTAGFVGFTDADPVRYAACAVAATAGSLLGMQVFRAISDANFRRVLLVLLMVSGSSLLLG